MDLKMLKRFYNRVWELSFWGRNLVSILIFLAFGGIIYYLAISLESGYPLFLVFLPLLVTSGFYFKKLNVYPAFLGSFSLFFLSVIYYGSQFFDLLYRSILNLSIFTILFVLTSILIGHVNYSFEELRKEKKDEKVAKEEFERQRDLLGSLLTHDIRNKMQIILGYLDLVKDDLEDNKRDKIKKAIDSVDKTISLTDKFKNIAKFTSNGEVMEFDINELKSYIRKAIKRNEEIISEKNLNFVSDLNRVKDDEVKVLAGPFIEDVVYNLIENALKHASCNKIKTSLSLNEEFVVLSVEDDGKGISDQQKDKIFSVEYTEKPSSGGLGLYFINKVIKTYDGEIEVKDSDLGGSRFDVKIQRSN